MSKSTGGSAGFTLFAWAVACLFHQLSFVDWRWDDPKGIVLTLAILWLLLRPSSWKRFAILLVVDWVVVAWTLSVSSKPHRLFLVVNGTLLASLRLAMRQHSSDPDLAAKWYRAFAPWVRIELCVLNFFTVFHKLNVSYFDLDFSCAAQMHREISDRMPLLPDAKWAQTVAIYRG